MCKKLTLFVICLCLIGLQTAIAQEVKNEAQKAFRVSKPSKVEHVPPLATRMMTLTRPDLSKKEAIKDGRSSKYEVVIGKGSTGDDILAINPHKMKSRISGKRPELVFETAASTNKPTDPAGAVGPNHYFSVTNTAFQIFDKNGKSLTGGLVAPNPTIFPSAGCCDLTASYDNDADRWILSILIRFGGGVQVAVSDGPDPVNDGWTVYTFTDITDYPKLSIWRDGYYMTENTNKSDRIHVFERAAMIDDPSAGTTPQIVSFVLPGFETRGSFSSPQVLNISNNNWPTSGGATVVYMQDDAWAGVSEDHIKIWTVDMDWTNASNSTVSAAQELKAVDGVSPFVSVFDGGTPYNLAQPNGQRIDALQATIMNQAQYRKFNFHNSAVFNFVVDVDGTSTKQAGVRWYELRQTADGQPWTVHQEGTYTAPDNRHAWNASLIMDKYGNIGMGYTGMSSKNSANAGVFVGSYYTGRHVNDPPGTMTIAEEVITAGNGNVGNYRYGDYSKIDVDPSNDKKFWFVNELINNGRKNVVGVFQVASDLNNDVGVISIDTPTSGYLTNNESVTVAIFNYTENAATNFDVTYQIDGGTVIRETYTGTIPSAMASQFTFSTPADFSIEGQTYTITASTDHGSDEDNTNDSSTKQVTYEHTNDIAVTAITAPTGRKSLSATEPVTVTIENFGTASQSNFDVSYSINSGTPVIENIAGPLASGSSMNYTFTTKGDFSAIRVYTIDAETLLGSDSIASNNSSQVTIETLFCMSETNNTVMEVGPSDGDITTSVITVNTVAVITDVNVTLNIEHTWDSDLNIKLIAPDGTEVKLFAGVGTNGDNFIGTVLDDEASTLITDGTAPFTGTFSPQGNLSDFIGLSSGGDWTLHIEDDYDNAGGNLKSWSIKFCTSPTLSTYEESLTGDFEILNKGNDQFEISLISDTLTEDLDLNVYNLLGQNLLWKTMKNKAGRYTYNLDMSYASPGVYLIRLGNSSSGITKRIVIE